MELIDLTLPWTDDCPSYTGYPDAKTYFFMRSHNEQVNAQMLEIPNHNGTHLDGERHYYMNGPGVGEIPLETLVTEGVVVDISDRVDDFGVYTAEDLLAQPVEIRPGDALIVHTGYQRYAYHQPTADVQRKFLRHPGPDPAFADWCLEMDFAWLGIDAASMDHPINLLPKLDRPDVLAECEATLGDELDSFGEGFDPIMHTELFRHGLVHVENVGGDIEEVLNERVVLGCFPWRMVDVESSPCRLVAFRGL